MPIPSDFVEKAALLQQGALAYLAAVRTPEATAESLIPGLMSWLASQSDSVRTLEVLSVSEQVNTLKVLNQQAAVVSTDVSDVFIFMVKTTYLDDGASAVTSVALSRASIEG